MKYLIGIVLFSFTLSAFGQQEWADTSFTNKKEAKNKTANGLKEGKWIEYFGEKNGVAIQTNKKHATAYTLTIYKAGKVHATRQFYMDGKLMTERIHHGKDLTFFRFYYESGKVLSEVTFPSDSKSRTERDYYESGKLKKEVIYTQGSPTLTKNYDENGNEIK